jgi:hypothetical protein
MKPSFVLACISWANVFVEGWLFILRVIPFEPSSTVPFAVFFVTAVLASGMSAEDKK